jgi:predicted nucleic acid-binding protein
VSPAFVADSSVGVAWAVLSQSSPAAERLLDEVASGRPFVVPALWPFEVANSLVVLMRRKRITAEQCARARRALSHLRPVVDDEGPRTALGRVSDVAEENGLSVYDAAYLELALRRGLPLASRDADLNRAAKLRGLATLL